MKMKMVGFKVGESRPTANRTVRTQDHVGSLTVDRDLIDDGFIAVYDKKVGEIVRQILDKSDFISIRRVND